MRTKFNSGLKISFYLCFVGIIAFLTSCQKNEFYTFSDFYKVNKTDAHMHYRTTDLDFLLWADSLKFKLITPNVYYARDKQFKVATTIQPKFPDKFAFFGTIEAHRYMEPDFIQNTIASIDSTMAAGAVGIKIWKNIGMEIQDSTGRYLMVDDPIFKPIFDYLEKKNIRLMAHLAEPRNCWLPMEEMTVASQSNYYKKNPQYYMYLHPEAPSYEDHMQSRDNLLIQHPNLEFIGAHLNSQEWSIDELGKSFERFPTIKVDMSGRVNHLMHQSLTRREDVRNFLIKYQDRIMYATDKGVNHNPDGYDKIKNEVLTKWLDEWTFLATDSTYEAPQLERKTIKGLQLPKKVIDKIFFQNAEYLFKSK